MTTHQKIAGAVAVIVLLVIGLTAMSLAIPQDSPPESTFAFASVATSSNGSLISIVMTNPSSEGICYYVGDAEFKSNGFWEEFRYTPRLKLQLLPPGRSVTNVVSVSATSEEARVPILWGFVPTVKANKLQQMWDDVASNIRMHNSRGRGALSTNFVTAKLGSSP